MTPLIVVGALVALLALPWAIDALLNRSGRGRPDACRAAARSLHARLWIADLHADSLLWNRNLLRAHRRGHVDLPRLLRGNVALQVFTAVSRVPLTVNYARNSGRTDLIAPFAVLQGWPVGTWFSAGARVRYQARKLDRLVRTSSGRLTLVRTARDVEELADRRRRGDLAVGCLLGVEGAHALHGRLENVDELFAAGFRLIGLAHFSDTEVGGSEHGLAKGGLTLLGQDVVRRMQRLGMIVDLAHASAAVIDDACAIAGRPVVVSHSGVRGTCDGPRSLTDDQLGKVAATGGLVGITYFPRATCGRDVAGIVRAIRYAADRAGVAHVALGSDFDGAVRTPLDAAGLPLLTDALLDQGFGEDEIAAIMGENVKRVLLATLPEGRDVKREG